MKLFLDDVRQPQSCIEYMKPRIGTKVSLYLEDWVVVKNYDQFTNFVRDNIGKITHVSFDHDLADIHYDPKTWTESFKYKEETGYDCAKWLVDFYRQKDVELPRIIVHSMNPIGTRNILNLFE